MADAMLTRTRPGARAGRRGRAAAGRARRGRRRLAAARAGRHGRSASGARHEVINNSIHSPAVENPPRTLEVLLDFWAGLGAATRSARDPAAVGLDRRGGPASGSSGRTASPGAIHSDPTFSVGGLRALLLQALHPVAMDGVARFSGGFKDEPWPRLIRTGDLRRHAHLRHPHRGACGRRRGCAASTGGWAASRRRPGGRTGWTTRTCCCGCTAARSTRCSRWRRRGGVPLTDDDADRYVAEQVTAAELIGIPAGRAVVGRRASRRTSRTSGPSLAVTPGRPGRLPADPAAADEDLGALPDPGPAGVGRAGVAGGGAAAALGAADVLAARPRR